MRLLLIFSLYLSAVLPAIQAAKHFNQIPGLYDETDGSLIKPIQGGVQFESAIRPKVEPHDERIHMVQFYMATCPDCQGFSPYFKRLISDIGTHWHNLLDTSVVNCNDDRNIQVCWQQNSKLLVPMIRWYPFSLVQNYSDSLKSNNNSDSKQQISWSHRETIEKQRRDHISLRRATLRFIQASLSKLKEIDSIEGQSSSNFSIKNPYLSRMPFRWQLFEPITSNNLEAELSRRSDQCLQKLSIEGATVANLIVFETPESYIGRTLVADWSNWTCSANLKDPIILVHFTNQLESLEINQSEPALVVWSWDSSRKSHSNHTLLASKSSILFRDRSGVDSKLSQRLKRRFVRQATKPSASKSKQRDTLQKFYSSKRNQGNPSNGRSPFYYLSEFARSSNAKRIRRSVNSRIDQENINWAPQELYADEEILRHEFNRRISEWIELSSGGNILIPAAGFDGGNPGEIVMPSQAVNLNSIVSPKDDDLKPTRLTDYYKVLAEMMNRVILLRAQVDGIQLMASACWLGQLAKRFPFQGLSSASQKSVAKTYLELMQARFTEKLNQRLAEINSTLRLDCSNFEARETQELTQETLKKLAPIKVMAEELELIQEEIRNKYDVGLPHDAHFKWSYCSGSNGYLRGHTCSLWTLFHVLTVHEYLEQLGSQNLTGIEQPTEEYEFVVDYEKGGVKANCDPKNPEPAFLLSSSRDLFVDATQFSLANIINFVRFYMSCTNCASHFNCMVKHSNINFDKPRLGDHLLWLWEAHNRVNIRTRGTHSEDPTHPKHIFPNYEACPECYLDKPQDLIAAGGRLESVKFNRQELIEFLVDRYRRSAILNNKIKIEELYKKVPANRINGTSVETNSANSTTIPYPLPSRIYG